MSPRNDRVGEKHGTFEVIAFSHVENNCTFWLCRCTVCGNESVRHNRYFRNDRPTPVGCQKCTGKYHTNFTGYEEMSGTYLTRVVTQAKERGYTFDCSYKDLWEVFLDQERKCYLTGVELSFTGDQTASLDRVDNSVGYTKGNIAWCHKVVNKMKNDQTLEDFVDWCFKVRIPKVPEVKNETVLSETD
jgi:hypothetical protein